MQSRQRNPNLRIVNVESVATAVPAGAFLGHTLAIDPIDIPTGFRLHLWAWSLWMGPSAAADSGHLQLAGAGGMFSADLYDDPATWLASFYLGPPPAFPYTLYSHGFGDAFGESLAGENALLEIPSSIGIYGAYRGSGRLVGFSTNFTMHNTDAVNARSFDAQLAALYSIEQ